MTYQSLSARRCLRAAFVVALACLPCLALAQPADSDAWLRANVDLRVGFETVSLPGNESMGLLGTSYLLELTPGLCVGPAVYGAISGQNGGLFTVGVETALCARLVGPLSVEAGLYVGGGGGGGAPVGSGLMLRPHLDLLWDFGGYRAGISVSKVRFPSGQIDSNQVGVVFGMDTGFTYLPSGRGDVPFNGIGRTGVGLDRLVAVGGAYRPGGDAKGVSGVALPSQIGFLGARADRFITPNLFGGIEASAAVSGDAAGYAEFLGTLGAEWPLAGDRFTLGGRVALGMGGGGKVPTGGGLLGKAALDAALRLSRNVSLNVEAGWAGAPQGSFRAPFASLGVRWDLEHYVGPPSVQTREEWVGGVAAYRDAARKTGPPQNLEMVTLKFNRFVGEWAYLTGQVQSAFAGSAGAFAVGLLGAGVQTYIGDRVRLGAELLAGGAGGGGVATGNGAIVQPMAYVGVDVSRSLSLRLGAGRVKAFNGGLDSAVADLTLAFTFGVAGRP